MSENFDANVASPAQVAERLRQLGVPADHVTTNAGPMATVSQDRQLQLLEQRNEQRKLARDARAAAYRAKLAAAVESSQRAPFDARNASAADAARRLAELGVRTDALEPLRDPRPAAQLPDSRSKATAIDAQLDSAARELLALERSGVRIDAREIEDPRVFQRYLAMKHGTSGWRSA
jgi:hypothetical protein